MRDRTWHWARKREKTYTRHKTGPRHLPWHIGRTRAVTGDRGPGGAPYSPAERNFWPPHGAARSASMARWRGAPLARPDDAPAVPREMTQTALAPLVFTKIPGGKGRRSPRSLCTILSLSGAHFVSVLCKIFGKVDGAPGYCAQFCRYWGLISAVHCAHYDCLKKKKPKTENTPIK